MKSEQEVKDKIAELKAEKKTWDDQWKDIESGKVPMLPPYADMVTRHLALYGYKIETLEWCVGEE
jgi:hypothetical protein